MPLYRRYISTKEGSKVMNEITLPEKHGSYGALLLDKRWKNKRESILFRDFNKCIICGLSEGLQIHHRQYHYLKTLNKFKAPWDYSDKMLITLCTSCHQRGHSKFKVPIIYI